MLIQNFEYTILCCSVFTIPQKITEIEKEKTNKQTKETPTKQQKTNKQQQTNRKIKCIRDIQRTVSYDSDIEIWYLVMIRWSF